MLEAEFWVAVAFVIFLGIAWKAGAFSAMTKGLDGRANRVRHELDEAKRLREEAATVLADYKRRRAEAEKEAEAIIAGAREEAKRAAEEGHRKLDDFLARRTKATELKISQAEAQAEAQVRATAADAAVKVSETILRERMQGDAAQGLIRASLGEVRTRLRA
ncbi:ATP F0F1 synthase subunit B [Methylobacterium sp. J-048]|uniref:F0F1 ATP synthase subunit B family protein n=1 Tax=Methylobacterium sp. J-048 TaxID=2836635 RepID=UPI001FB9074D|nr:ATP F0F1 synthase subunit B [Methylobacterium sp. J-048]MCJ2055428.1 ATP F0F1 synthase subunit B [Methylobacterium sp. J-048]